MSSRLASMRSFSANGSPTWTVGRFAWPSSPKVADARMLAPPIPSRPVVLPKSTHRLPGPGADASVRRSSRRMPTAITFTSGFSA